MTDGPSRRAAPKSFRDNLSPTTYGVLVFGLLVILIAAVSLPQLLKLQVGGVALEKSALEPELPSQLGIAAERDLAGVEHVKVAGSSPVDPPRPSKKRAAPDIASSGKPSAATDAKQGAAPDASQAPAAAVSDGAPPT